MAPHNARNALVLEIVAKEAGTFFYFDTVTGLWMTSGGGLRIGCYEELTAVELGDMRRGIEELAVFGSGEDVGYGGGVESVGAEKLEEN